MIFLTSRRSKRWPNRFERASFVLSRFVQYARHGGDRQKAMAKRFLNEKSLATARELGDIAAEAGWKPAALALAWSKRHDYVASTIVGANSVEQLDESLEAIDRELPADLAARLDAISAKYPYPLG
jgi:aryl-alcohol dehydrogenase-like predicted oxidoreductase